MAVTGGGRASVRGLPGAGPGRGRRGRSSGRAGSGCGRRPVRGQGRRRRLIDLGYYADPRDLDLMVSALRRARTMGGAGALAPWRTGESAPSAEVTGDEESREYVKLATSSLCHGKGGCDPWGRSRSRRSQLWGDGWGGCGRRRAVDTSSGRTSCPTSRVRRGREVYAER
ncbi:GMC oxidoreductase [Streptomyces sp. NPDC059761]|uniref:GMC oxidoreductase n=1 Tax=Streptomyces sp. NPDC059761 TaxID=3346937 RepID=UPI0036625F58